MPRQVTMPSRKRFQCKDCAIDTGKAHEHYFVNDALWNAAGMGKVGMLCIGCLELRIGRELTPNDFTACYLNRASTEPKSLRLADRMGLTPLVPA